MSGHGSWKAFMDETLDALAGNAGREARKWTYQWAWRLGDRIAPCRDEQNARDEVARFPNVRALVRRRVGPWEVVPAPAPDDDEGEPE